MTGPCEFAFGKPENLLVTPDPSFVQLAKCDLLVPMLVYRDKNQVVEKLQTIPWTYVSVDEVDGSTGRRVKCKAVSGGWFWVVRSVHELTQLSSNCSRQYVSTQVELLTQTKPNLPLVAHRIEVRTEPVIPRKTDENPNVDPSSTLLNELLTDRRGLTNVSRDSEHSLVWLFAFSGQHLLARVPFIPGITQSARLEVPDDATRLAAEADLQMLQGEVIDAVALRNTAFATMRAAAKKSKIGPRSNRKLELLKKLQDVGALQRSLKLGAGRCDNGGEDPQGSGCGSSHQSDV